MQEWAKTLSRPETVRRVNAQFTAALAYCPNLEAAGWTFRCSECHIATGTYAAGFGFDWHSHREYQIEVALAGAFEFETDDGSKILLRPGRALVIPWKFAHSWKCLRPGAMLGLSLELLPTPASIRNNGWLINQMQMISHGSVKLRADELLTEGIAPAKSDFLGKTVSCRLFLLLALLTDRLFPSSAAEEIPADPVAEARGREIIGRVVAHIGENPGADIRLTHVAREVGVSGRHLHRLFLKHVGSSLHDYLLEQRLEKARQMLCRQGTKARVKEIAFACGFNSLAYFSNSFHKVFGVTPSALLAERRVLTQRSTVFNHHRPEEAGGGAGSVLSDSSLKK